MVRSIRINALMLLACAAASTAAQADVALQTGLNGTWWNASQDGQGFVIHIIPETDQAFVAWFTYGETGGKQMWITGSGNLQQSPVQLDLLKPGGGALNASQPAPDLNTWGTATLRFDSCTRGSFSYQGESSGTIEIERLTPVVECSNGAGQ
ncbi:MAG: hypothetical protein QNJ40_09555 [Xanthomonadales bacterium]|nr:hypothetical protein [Xanthomonadales bacterium]